MNPPRARRPGVSLDNSTSSCARVGFLRGCPIPTFRRDGASSPSTKTQGILSEARNKVLAESKILIRFATDVIKSLHVPPVKPQNRKIPRKPCLFSEPQAALGEIQLRNHDCKNLSSIYQSRKLGAIIFTTDSS